MLMFCIPAWRNRVTAWEMSSRLCLRWRNFRRSLLKVCAPILTRLNFKSASWTANSSVMSSGLHSMVSSFKSDKLPHTLYIYVRSWFNCSEESILGVPPPKYIVWSLLSESVLRLKSSDARRSISWQSISTYFCWSDCCVVL